MDEHEFQDLLDEIAKRYRKLWEAGQERIEENERLHDENFALRGELAEVYKALDNCMKERDKLLATEEGDEATMDEYGKGPDSVDNKKEAFVDANGWYHCPCGAEHSRGPLNGEVYRCLKCGNAYKVDEVVDQRCK